MSVNKVTMCAPYMGLVTLAAVSWNKIQIHITSQTNYFQVLWCHIVMLTAV